MTNSRSWNAELPSFSRKGSPASKFDAQSPKNQCGTNASEKSSFRKPSYHDNTSPVCRQKRFQVFLLAPVAPIVVSHAYPIERERRDELVNARRVAAHRDAVRYDRLAALFDGIARHVPVARIVERNERLNPRVAEILQLFVVGTVHVGLVRAQARRPPADVEHAVQLRMSRCVER